MNDVKRELEETYDSIAPFFSMKRQSLWPPMESFLKEVSPCRILDLGCGTGRVMIAGIRLGSRMTGFDISGGQLEMAERNLHNAGLHEGYELVRGDLEDLPFADETFDAVLMIASLHHIPTRKGRIMALSEAQRVLKDRGRLQVSVWSWDQDRFRERHMSLIRKERKPDEFDGPEPGDVFVPWNEGGRKMRFYHLYGHHELEEEVNEAGLILERAYFDRRNHWVECRR